MAIISKKKFQVFVSSTYNDLKEERQEAVSAILKAGHIPAGMELFTAGSKSQLEVIKKWIEESDIYMLILGTRYGAIEPISKLSYTEVEYDFAVSLGKPLFAIVLNDHYCDYKLKSLGAAAAESNNSAALVKFRKKVLDVMCSIISELKEVRGAIYENLIETTSANDLVGWVSAALLEDTRPLRNSIVELEKDKERLQAELDERRLIVAEKPQQPASRGLQLEELWEVLQKDIPLPAGTNDNEKDETRNLSKMLMNNRNMLVRGWNITRNTSKVNKWFEDQILPELIIHRIVSKSTIENGFRYETTEKGLDLLAWRDAERIQPVKDLSKKRPEAKKAR